MKSTGSKVEISYGQSSTHLSSQPSSSSQLSSSSERPSSPAPSSSSSQSSSSPQSLSELASLITSDSDVYHALYRYGVSDAYYHEMSMMNPNLVKLYRVKNAHSLINALIPIAPLPHNGWYRPGLKDHIESAIVSEVINLKHIKLNSTSFIVIHVHVHVHIFTFA